MCTFGVLRLSCETPGEDPQEGEERNENCGGRVKQKNEILGGLAEGVWERGSGGGWEKSTGGGEGEGSKGEGEVGGEGGREGGGGGILTGKVARRGRGPPKRASKRGLKGPRSPTFVTPFVGLKGLRSPLSLDLSPPPPSLPPSSLPPPSHLRPKAPKGREGGAWTPWREGMTGGSG